MQIETLDRRSLSETDAHVIAELIVAIWPKPGRTVDTLSTEILNQWKDYRGPENQHPRSFLIREGGPAIAHSAAYPRTIGTPNGEMTILALARVCTDPAVRGRKLGRAVVLAAFDLVDRGLFPFAMFQTSHAVRPFYEGLGAVTVDNHFVNSLAEEPMANPFWAEVIMRYPAREGWPTGEIDLRGPGW